MSPGTFQEFNAMIRTLRSLEITNRKDFMFCDVTRGYFVSNIPGEYDFTEYKLRHNRFSFGIDFDFNAQPLQKPAEEKEASTWIGFKNGADSNGKWIGDNFILKLPSY